MKSLILGLFVLFSSTAVFAIDPAEVNCAKQAKAITLQDIFQNARELSIFKKGELRIEYLSYEDVKNIIYLTELDLDNETVTYKTSLIGKVSSTDNAYTQVRLSECEIKFEIEGCEMKQSSCSSTYE